MAERTQLIDGNRVFCPLRGKDVDIESCLMCRRLLRLDREPPAVHCRLDLPLEQEPRIL